MVRLIAPVLCVLVTAACSQLATDPVSVQVDPPHTTVKYLDEIYWPQKTAFGRAFTDWSFICMPVIKVEEKQNLRQSNQYVFEVTGVSIKVQLEMIESLPYGVKNPLRLHEDMHCKMTAEVYKASQQAAMEIGKKMIGKKIVVKSADSPRAAKAAATLEARRQITTAFRKLVSNKADALAIIFDRVTRHGMNGVTNEEGSRKSFEEYDKKNGKGKDGEGDELGGGTSSDAGNSSDEREKRSRARDEHLDSKGENTNDHGVGDRPGSTSTDSARTGAEPPTGATTDIGRRK